VAAVAAPVAAGAGPVAASAAPVAASAAPVAATAAPPPASGAAVAVAAADAGAPVVGSKRAAEDDVGEDTPALKKRRALGVLLSAGRGAARVVQFGGEVDAYFHERGLAQDAPFEEVWQLLHVWL